MHKVLKYFSQKKKYVKIFEERNYSLHIYLTVESISSLKKKNFLNQD